MLPIRLAVSTLTLLLAVAPQAARADAPPMVELDRGLARAHFEKGRALYEKSAFADALGEFRAASSLVDAPALFYNIGLCEERLFDFSAAIDAYERFVTALPNDPAAPSVRARVQALKSGIAAVQLARAAPVAPRPSVVAPAIVGGAALSLATIGAGLLGHAGVQAADRRAGCCSTGEVDLLRGQADAGYALLGVGAALAIVDVGLWIRWGRLRHQEVTR